MSVCRRAVSWRTGRETWRIPSAETEVRSRTSRLYAGDKSVTKFLALLDPRRSAEALPTGYRLEYDPDVLLIRRDDGSAVAVFSARGVDRNALARAAGDDQLRLSSWSGECAPRLRPVGSKTGIVDRDV